jgi:hypothetical protein
MPETLDEHYERVFKAIAKDRVIPFFGAGVNLCGRPKDMTWRRGSKFLPSGVELAEHLAKEFQYPWSDRQDLLRVSQYAAIMNGTGPLYDELRVLFDADYEITPLHRFFAQLPAALREKGYSSGGQLIVTTNYDDLMERAFREAGEEFDLVAYTADDKHQRGKFWHWPPGGEARIIEIPNKYLDLSLERRSIILKIHGAIDRENSGRDSFVITEDNYIDYLTRTDISNLVPVTVAAKLSTSHFLFLGYSLRDWNLRVILHRIWGEQKLSYKSWAILLNPQPLDQEFWRKRDVDIYNASLEDYITALAERVSSHPRAEV